MKFKKLLLVISIVIISMFGLMLTTSYAWYSFENGSTTFETVTQAEKVYVSYQDGEYINTNIAVPIDEEQVDKYSSKNNFNIKINENVNDEEVVITVSLTEVTIDDVLKNENFIIDLFYQGKKIDTVDGLEVTSNTDIVFDSVLLNQEVSNQFEVRVYLLDDESNQNSMMNKTFSAKVKVDVVSRLKPVLNDYDNPDIKITNIMIDGASSDSIPSDGYYSMSYDCTKGSNLSWDPLSRTITYKSGSYINDSCSLSFTTSTDYPLLSEMLVGSYVAYTGNNGCDGTLCEGENANYESDKKMGYCYDDNYQFITSGWRIGYIENGSVYLVSAGAVECVSTNSDGTTSNVGVASDEALNATDINKHLNNINNVALKYCNAKYVSGGVCSNSTVWSMNEADVSKILGTTNNFSDCENAFSNKSCGYTDDLVDNGSYYWIAGLNGSSSVYYWNSYNRYVAAGSSNLANGVRPVIYLDSSIVVVSQYGTYKNPYVISIG